MKTMNNKSSNFEWAEKLIQQYLDNNNYQELNMKDKYNDTGFIWVCTHQPKLAELMLKRSDIDFNSQDNWGITGFMMACIHQPELAEIMLNKEDIDFNIQNDLSNTGFMWACRFQPELLKRMLNNKEIDKTLKNKAGLTGYDLAKKYNPESFEIYEAWLEHKNINTQVQKRSKKLGQHL